ncbi:MAG: ATP-binding protein, partial [Chloroflexi bacterium]|nr:ATP-binding protein [Chloroflexota bacterium]
MSETAMLPLNPQVPSQLIPQLLFLPDRARNMGIHLVASKGTGKSRLMGRMIAWLDFVRGVPLVLFDPHGPSIDNFLDKLTRLPPEMQERLWPRVLYVDMAGCGGSVIPFPLYYRSGDESLYAISQRYLDVVRRLDPYLQTASIEGWNALWRIGTCAGMILAASGLQITEAEDLVRDPKRWAGCVAEACRQNPEAAPAAEFFTQDFLRLNANEQARRADSFLNKTALFRLDPTMKAMFGANRPGIDWNKVVEQSQAVLIDFRGERDLERMRFKLLWSFGYLMDFIKRRGPGRHKPISLIIDEITYLLSPATLHTDLLAADLDELINRIARNYMVWLTLAHQELYQVSEAIQKTLLTMGTQIFGSTTDLEAALSLSRRFFRFDPYRVKKTEPVYSTSFGISSVI